VSFYATNHVTTQAGAYKNDLAVKALSVMLSLRSMTDKAFCGFQEWLKP
jgi:hypothetical protein